MRLLSFTMMIALTGLLGHIYVYRRVVRRISRARAWRWSAGGVLVLMTVLLASRGAFRSDPQLARVYAVVAYTWIAFLVCMVIAIAAGDVVAIVNAAISWRQRKGAPPHPAREAPPRSTKSAETSSRAPCRGASSQAAPC